MGPCGNCAFQGHRARVSTRLHHAATHAAQLNVCISRWLQQRLALAGARVVFNPVSPDIFRAHAPGPGVAGLVVFAGRLVEEKGLDLLLRALVRIPEACLEVAGDGPMRARWEGLAADLGLRARVKFLGRLETPELLALYARAAVVCVPTLCPETFGYAAAEPMAMERAVVVTPHGALRELAEEDRGYLATSGSAEDLTQALVSALADDAERARRAANARVHALRWFQMASVGEQYLQVYRDAAEPAR